MNVVGTVLDELYRAFAILNKEKFDDSLPYPVITIQKDDKNSSFGYFIKDKIWKRKGDENPSLYEINLNPNLFDTISVNETIGTLLHEMCHYYNAINDIEDVKGNSHNKIFKATAESVGLICEKQKGVGFGLTMNSDELNQFIDKKIAPDEDSFAWFRFVEPKEIKPKKKTTFTFTCPTCGMKAKGKESIRIKCAVCDEDMQIEEIEEPESEDNFDE